MIEANSEATNSGGGGSGGSIFIRTQVLTGGHTGAIRATGGRAQGGGGAGGRIAAYFSNRETEPFFGGAFETQGGNASVNAEPGASGTTFLKHVAKGYSTIRVDNKNQKSAGHVIGNEGRRLTLSGGSNGGQTYSLPDGTTVLSSRSYHSSWGYPYYIGRMFDEDPGTRFMATTQSARITFNFKSAMVINHVRLYPACSAPSRFKVKSFLNIVCEGP